MATEPPKRRLRIGVSASFFHPDAKRNLFKGKMLLFAEESMLRLVMSAGALPVLLPRAAGAISLYDLIADIDGLILQGGADMSPRSYGETALRPEWEGDLLRDDYEMELVHACMAADRPVLGICRGHQVLNVALGGTLWQDIETQHPDRGQHRQWDVYDRHAHDVAVEPSSLLARWYALDAEAKEPHRGRINSVHHQAVKDVGRGLVVEARSVPDGVVEAVRYVGEAVTGGRVPFALGVQWHPEFMLELPDARNAPWLDPRVIIKQFVEEVRARTDARDAEPGDHKRGPMP